MQWRMLIWLFGTVLAMVAVSAAADSNDGSTQYLCVGDFSCYGSAVKYSVALLQSAECSFNALGYTSGSYFQVPFDSSRKLVLNISVDWRQQAPPTPTTDTGERVLYFDYEYVVIDFTSSAVVSNILQVQPIAVNDSQSASSFFALHETQQDRRRVDIFHVYQDGRGQAQPGVAHWPVILVQLLSRNVSWGEEQLLTWNPTAWSPMTLSCECQRLPWSNKENDDSCKDVRYCYLSPFYVDQQGMCSVHQTKAFPNMSKASQMKFRIIGGFVLLAGACLGVLLFCHCRRGRNSNPNPNNASQIGLCSKYNARHGDSRDS
jgi:hypothetical protein